MTERTEKIRLQKAKQRHLNGSRLFHEKKYSKAKSKLVKCLAIRESLIGFYHKDSAKTYTLLGYTFYSLGKLEDALIAFRTYGRIRGYISGKVERNKHHTVKKILQSKGIIGQEAEQWYSNLKTSIDSEKVGDTHRKKGEFEKAIELYKDAIELEEACIGNDRCLAFLWRKIALIGGRTNNRTISFILFHRIDPKTINDQNFLNVDARRLIKDGDICHAKYNIPEAIEHYKKVASSKERQSTSLPRNEELSKLRNELHETMDSIQAFFQKQNDRMERLEKKIDIIQKDAAREKKRVLHDTVNIEEEEECNRKKRRVIEDHTEAEEFTTVSDSKEQVYSFLSCLRDMNYKLLQNQTALIESLLEKPKAVNEENS